MKQTKGKKVSGERLLKTMKRLSNNMEKAKIKFNKMQQQALEDARKLIINK
jgi:hypothetical protein